jgi:PAS domain S-box-containing protein
VNPERRRRWRIGIALQLDLIVVLVVLAMGGVLGAFFVHAQGGVMESALEARTSVAGRYLAAAAEARWGEATDAGLDAILTAAVLDPEIAYVLLVAPDGAVRAARSVATEHGGVVERVFPIHAKAAVGAEVARDGAVLGTVAMGVDRAPLDAERRELVLRTVLALLLSAALAAAFGHLLVAVLVQGALSRLVEGIRALASGDLSRRLGLEVRTSEIAEMGRAVDEMAERLSGALATLGEREAHVRLLLESTAEAIYGIDLEGRCTFANPACARLLGFRTADELIGRQVHALFHHSTLSGAALAEAECPILRAVRGDREYHSEDETYWRADGQPLAVECRSYPVRRHGALIGGVITFLDVSERHRMEEELLNMRKLESLGVLAGGIAHDFNNLLTGVLGNLSLAQEQVGPGHELRELLDESEQAAQRARALTQQLLTFSKGGAPVKRILSVRVIVQDAATFALRGSAVRGDLSADEGLWSVEADAGQLAQVVQNLVLNGVQAMPRGGTISVGCDNVELGAVSGVPLPAGRYVRVSVRDEGLGIPPEHLQRIFDPYFTTKRTGSGLGLATVYAIVKKHGGHVSVSSRVGGGTTFDVWLPATGRAADPEALHARPAARGRGRVLVMDDERVVRSTAAGMLETLGYEVLAAADGAEAVALYEAERRAGRPIAAVLMDLTVPGGMGGVEALRRLRVIDPAVRAVATSGYSNDPVMAAHGAYGFSGVLPKPYTLDDLARAIADVVCAAGAVAGGPEVAPAPLIARA